MPYDRNGTYFSSADGVATSEAINRVGEKIDENGRHMSDAFNNIAKALQELTQEVRGLRSDLNPDLGKSKLNTPQAKG